MVVWPLQNAASHQNTFLLLVPLQLSHHHSQVFLYQQHHQRLWLHLHLHTQIYQVTNLSHLLHLCIQLQSLCSPHPRHYFLPPLQLRHLMRNHHTFPPYDLSSLHLFPQSMRILLLISQPWGGVTLRVEFHKQAGGQFHHQLGLHQEGIVSLWDHQTWCQIQNKMEAGKYIFSWHVLTEILQYLQDISYLIICNI